MAALDHWKRRPRETSGPFVPGAMPGKQDLKHMEEEITRQVQALHSMVQRDLDLLHEQVHNEVYTALSQELVSVAQNLTAIRTEGQTGREELKSSVSSSERNVGALTTVLERMREELTATKASAQGAQADLTGFTDKLQSINEGVQVSLGRAEAMLQKDVSDLRKETQSIRALLVLEDNSKSMPPPDDFIQRVAELETKLPKLEKGVADSLSAEAAERATRAGELAVSIELSRAEARQSAEKLEASIREVAAEASKASAVEFQEELKAVTQENFRKTGETLSMLEKRLAESTSNEANEQVAGKCKSLEARVATLVKEVDLQFDDSRKEIRQLTTDTNDGLRFAQNCWTRSIEWLGAVNLEELDKTGRFDMDSAPFTAAGLRGLQLCLRVAVVAEKPGRHSPAPRWTCGAFLRGSQGQVSFRLQVAGKSQSFAGDFANAPEWGSQRIVTLESVGASVPVKLEILDVTVDNPFLQGGLDSELISTFQMTDAARVATREADKVRSSMVRRIEWRIVDISKRIAAARAAVASGHAEKEALEPLLSPTFSAGGLEGLQLQLYPLGYLRRDDVMPSSNYEEKCGFFLVCPRGVYMKCQAFVGNQAKIFEHQYTEREPFGRAQFCRLIDKAGNDDSVVCGIEIQDVRQEATTQVKGGPFGGIVDQMKVTLVPNLGSMEVMRELLDPAYRDKGDKGVRVVGKTRQPVLPGTGAYPGASLVAAALQPLGPGMMMSNSQSMPLLTPLGEDREGPPSPSPPPAKQKMRLPNIQRIQTNGF